MLNNLRKLIESNHIPDAGFVTRMMESIDDLNHAMGEIRALPDPLSPLEQIRPSLDRYTKVLAQIERELWDAGS